VILVLRAEAIGFKEDIYENRQRDINADLSLSVGSA